MLFTTMSGPELSLLPVVMRAAPSGNTRSKLSVLTQLFTLPQFCLELQLLVAAAPPSHVQVVAKAAVPKVKTMNRTNNDFVMSDRDIDLTSKNRLIWVEL